MMTKCIRIHCHCNNRYNTKILNQMNNTGIRGLWQARNQNSTQRKILGDRQLCSLFAISTSKWPEVEVFIWNWNSSKPAVVSNLPVEMLSQLIFIIVVYCAKVQCHQTAEILVSLPKESNRRTHCKKQLTLCEECCNNIQMIVWLNTD